MRLRRLKWSGVEFMQQEEGSSWATVTDPTCTHKLTTAASPSALWTSLSFASPVLMSLKRSHGDIGDQPTVDIAAMSNKRPRACNSSKPNPASSTVEQLLSTSSVSSSSTSGNSDGTLSAFYRASHHSSSLETLYKPICTISGRPQSGNGAYHAALPEKATESEHDELQEAHEEIRRLRAELASKDKMLRNKDAQAKQDLLLQTVLENDQLAKIRAQLRRERNHSLYIAEKSKRHATTLEGQLKEERLNLLRAQNDVNMYKEDAEHYQALNRVAEEDLAELRRIEAEDRQQRSLRSRGLPPAYGSLDDEDVIPPYGQHRDSGAAGLMTLKRVVRSDFKYRTYKYQAVASASNASNLKRHERDTNLILSLTDALSLAATSIQNYTTYPDDLNVRPAGGMQCDGGRRSKATCSRLAKLLIDLTQRFISAIELRPLTPRFDSNKKALLFVAFTSIDSALFEIFHLAFDSRDRLLEMQYYLTLVTCLQEQLKKNLRSALPTLSGPEASPFFEQSSTWLGEQVEKERQLAADDPHDASAPTPYEQGGSDVLSSVFALSVASTMSGSEESAPGLGSDAGPSNRAGSRFRACRSALWEP